MGSYYSAARFLVRVGLGLFSRREVRGVEQIPRSGGLIVASNHVSYWDPPVVGSVLPRGSYFLAKQELFSSRWSRSLISGLNTIPIRRGAADLGGLTRAIEVLKRGEALVMFPEGSRMKDGELHPARPGVGLLAVQSNARIVPCYVSGTNRPGQWLGRRATIRIWFGPSRHWREMVEPGSDTPGRELYQRLGEAVMRDIARLRDEQRQSASRGAA